MSLHLRLIGLAFAIAVGAGLWYVWPEVRFLMRGTWLADLWLPALLVYALGGMWIAERIWAIIAPLLERKRS
jgi:hypothetical protein